MTNNKYDEETSPVTSDLVEAYKHLLSHLLVERALGSVSAEQEAERAEERAVIWDQLSTPEQTELEAWIDSQMNVPRPTSAADPGSDYEDPAVRPRNAESPLLS